MAIEFVAAATDGGNNVDTVSPAVPTGTQDDDVLIAFVTVSSGSGWGAWTAPAGWTLIDDWEDTTGADMRVYLGYKVASSESGTYSFTTTTLIDRPQGTVVAYRGVDTSDPLDVAWVRASHSAKVENLPSSSTNTNAPAITTESNNAMVVLFDWISHNDMEAVNGYGPPTGYTTRFEQYNESAAYRGQYICDKIVTSADTTETPGDFTHTENGTGVNDSQSHTIALKEAGGAAGRPNFLTLLGVG